MGYRFGYNGSTSSHQDWSSSTITPYGGTTVDSIPDTTTTQKEITSIPSPFARMELVKEAFAKVIPGAVIGYSRDEILNLLHGTSVYHKTVSDTLDVAQIFFSYPSLADKVDILRWDRVQGITALTNSGNAVHNVVGKTLDMFRSQDAQGADPYNFSLFNDMYILRYKGPGHREMHIIGATSPATLFFSTANDENAISRQICFGRDYAFDGAYASLEMRDPEFIAYLFAYRHSDSSFAQHYPEVDKYLAAVYTVLGNQLQQRIGNIGNAIRGGNSDYLDKNYEPITFTTIDGTQHTVQVNGCTLHYKPLVVAGNSDFQISPTRQYNGTPPLVLPITKGGVYANLRYVRDPFGTQHTVPSYDSNTLAARRLPGIGVQYPYLTVSDFLDDTIVRLSAPVNSADFFDGNISGNTQYGYLLPILPTYFDFFSVNDLMGITLAGHKAIELKVLAGDSVEVTLRIPIKGNNDVEYKRIYTPNVPADKTNNTGTIVTVSDSYTAGLFPPVQFTDAATAHYRVALVDNYAHSQHDKCEFHSAEQGFFGGDYVVRNTTCRNDLQTKVYLLEGKLFDCLRLTVVGGASGLLIPHFHQPSGNNKLSFAIDLGTTNTHIEYSTGTNNLSQPFTYDASQALMRWVCQPKDSNVVDHICGELLPAAIGNSARCHFPLRTVLCKDRTNSGINGGGTGDYVPFGNASPAFMYNKSDVGKGYNDYIPNLKWSSDDKAQENLRCYIESLLLMLRAKVLYEGGDLAKTEIRWFYPVSMSQHKRSMLVQIWDDAYKKYFNSQGATTNISESVAPYSFFQSTNAGVTDVVTIDIGGGTTDVVVANSSGAQMITSMRFAADALFGSSLLAVNNGPLNGIVKQFKAHFLQHLASIPSLADILKAKTVNDCGASAEVASFYFSLVDNEEVQKQRIQNKVDFHRLLQNDQRQKVVFYIFYCALLYHTAHLMCAKGLPAPLNIAFSGNGSKTVSVLSADKSILEEVATAIFDLIYPVDVPRITIFLQDNPKEATCKGGLLNDTLAKDKAVSPAVLLGNDTTTLVNNQRYRDVKSLFPAVVKEVGEFIDFILLTLPGRISLNNLLGISDNDIALAVQSYNGCNMEAFVDKGVALKLKSGELNNTDIIEETLFFYPIIGWMNDISEKVYQQPQTIYQQPQTKGN